MDKMTSIIIGIFLYPFYGQIINNGLYYAIFVTRFLFEFLYWASSLIGLTSFGALLYSVMYYIFIYSLFKFFWKKGTDF